MRTLQRFIPTRLVTAVLLLATARGTSPAAAVPPAGSLARVHRVGTLLLQSQGSVAPSRGRARGPETVSVKDFGAVGDGMKDDTDAFNSAYEYLSDFGGKISVPKSSRCYMVTEILRRTGVSLSGDGPDSTCIKKAATPGQSLPLLSTRHIIDPVTDETIEDLTLDGNRGAQTGITGDGDSDCILLRAYKKTVLRNLIVKDCYTDGIYVIGSGARRNVNGNGLLIDHVQVTNSRRNNLSIICGDNITITASSFTNANGTKPESGIDIEPDAAGQITNGLSIGSDVTISNNKGAGLSMYYQFQSQPSMDLVIDGTFSGNNGGGIVIITTPPYIVGRVHISGTFLMNRADSQIGINMAGLAEVVLDKIQIDQDGTAVRAARVSDMEIASSARLSGTTSDLYLKDDTTSVRLESIMSLVHQSISGSRAGLSIK
jgi:hypothetical protein